MSTVGLLVIESGQKPPSLNVETGVELIRMNREDAEAWQRSAGLRQRFARAIRLLDASQADEQPQAMTVLSTQAPDD